MPPVIASLPFRRALLRNSGSSGGGGGAFRWRRAATKRQPPPGRFGSTAGRYVHALCAARVQQRARAQSCFGYMRNVDDVGKKRPLAHNKLTKLVEEVATANAKSKTLQDSKLCSRSLSLTRQVFISQLELARVVSGARVVLASARACKPKRKVHEASASIQERERESGQD